MLKRILFAMLVGAGALWSTPGAAAAPPVTTPTAQTFAGVWAPEPRGPQKAGDARGPGFAPPPAGRLGGPPPGPPQGRGITITKEDQAKGLEAGDIHTRALMTEAGKAKFATYDPLMHPTSNCRSPGLPSIAQIPELQEWRINADGVTIRHESYGTVRTASFVQTIHPAGAHTPQGHAIARLDGPDLMIETANLAAEWGGLGRAAPGSDQRVVREIYHLVDADTIEGVIEISDPLYLTQTLRMPVRLKRQPADTQIVDFPCDVEVAQRDYQYIRDGVANSRSLEGGGP